MQRILIIDDDIELCGLLTEYLEEAGLSCGCAHRPEQGLALAAEQAWDMVLLDVMLPGQSGLEVLHRLRRLPGTAGLPVLMLSARGEESDKVVGLEMGADDYLAKPFSARELLARIRALLRRVAAGTDQSAPQAPVQVGDLRLRPDSLQVTVAGKNIEISAVELRLLETLVETPGAVAGRDHLYRTVLGHASHPFDRRLDMLVSRIRKKLGPREDGGERIKAVRGEGYVYLLPGTSL